MCNSLKDTISILSYLVTTHSSAEICLSTNVVLCSSLSVCHYFLKSWMNFGEVIKVKLLHSVQFLFDFVTTATYQKCMLNWSKSIYYGAILYRNFVL